MSRRPAAGTELPPAAGHGLMDYRLVLAARVLRGFGFGFAAVLLGVHLERRGVGPAQIGLALTLGLAAASVLGLVLAGISNSVGRRLTLAFSGVLMALAGVDLALAHRPWLLILAGLTGMLGAASVDLGPFLAVEQALLSETVEPKRRNMAFARYSLTGGLAAALGGLLATGARTPELVTDFFWLYAFLGGLTAILPAFMSARVEVREPVAVFASFRPLLGLSALFAVDSFGGGLVVQAVIAYWLHARFGAGPTVLGPAFAAMGLLQALSYELSGRLSDRFGLVNTMIVTHLPSNVLLILVPLSPNLAWAVGLLLARQAISQMDVPARQAYLVSIVSPGERAGAVALTGAVRGGAQAFGPLLAGVAIQSASYGIPFYVAGAFKIVYDLSLYAGFRNRKGDHET